MKRKINGHPCFQYKVHLHFNRSHSVEQELTKLTLPNLITPILADHLVFVLANLMGYKSFSSSMVGIIRTHFFEGFQILNLKENSIG